MFASTKCSTKTTMTTMTTAAAAATTTTMNNPQKCQPNENMRLWVVIVGLTVTCSFLPIHPLSLLLLPPIPTPIWIKKQQKQMCRQKDETFTARKSKLCHAYHAFVVLPSIYILFDQTDRVNDDYTTQCHPDICTPCSKIEFTACISKAIIFRRIQSGGTNRWHKHILRLPAMENVLIFYIEIRMLNRLPDKITVVGSAIEYDTIVYRKTNKKKPMDFCLVCHQNVISFRIWTGWFQFQLTWYAQWTFRFIFGFHRCKTKQQKARNEYKKVYNFSHSKALKN